MADDVHGTVAQQLRRARQRYTSGRRQLVALLLAIDRPVTIPELIEEGASQSQSSLYRNLAILEQCGAVRRLASVGENARYELDEALTEHHHHVVCSKCGRIADLILPAEIERALQAAAAAALEQDDFLVDSHRLELLGTCSDCR